VGEELCGSCMFHCIFFFAEPQTSHALLLVISHAQSLVLCRAVWGHCFEVLQVSTPTWMLMPQILFLSENQSTLQTFMIFCTQFLDKSHLVTNQQGVLLLSWFHSNTGFQIMCDLWFRRDLSNSNFVTGLESDICDDMLYNTKVRSSNKVRGSALSQVWKSLANTLSFNNKRLNIFLAIRSCVVPG
jgi:hypothetical protein